MKQLSGNRICIGGYPHTASRKVAQIMSRSDPTGESNAPAPIPNFRYGIHNLLMSRAKLAEPLLTTPITARDNKSDC